MYRYVKSGDQSDILRAGYWSSYNVPFYENVFDALGYSTAVEAYGTEFSYQLCPRAKIFRRDQGKVLNNIKVDLPYRGTFEGDFIRYNIIVHVVSTL